jgi:RHS repeat-associated protein
LSRTNANGFKIDQLKYNYKSAVSNQIDNVKEELTSTEGNQGFPVSTNAVNDFVYDANGNLTKDVVRGVKSITYNMINLVNTVELDVTKPDPIKGTQSYVYAADGTKLSFTQIRANAEGNNRKSYIGAIEYDAQSKILRIGTEEGHVMLRPNWNENSKDSKYVYYYTIKDHLGNVRMVLDDDANANIWQKTDYNAFGLDAKNDYPQGTNAAKERNNHLYNDKEFDPETARLDYGFRQYDNVLGRWFVVDPMAERYYSLSPYNYVFNNPTALLDPDGRYVDVSSIYEKNKNGDYKNPELVEAFNNFASSKEGIALLSKFAQKGQVIAGHEYSSDGVYHSGVSIDGQNVRIDLAYKATDIKDKYGREDDANGRTDVSIKNGKGQIDILLNKNNASEKQDYKNNPSKQNRNNYIWDATETILHESYIYGIYDANDIADNGKADRSNMPIINSYGVKIRQGQHEYYRANYKTHPYTTQGMELLKRLNNQYGIYPTNTNKNVFQHMWNFSD